MIKKLQNIIWHEGKFYVAQCLNVDISSFGESKEEAIRNLNEALELYFANETPKEILKIDKIEIIESDFQYA